MSACAKVFFLLTALILTSCEKLCGINVPETTQLQNATGRDQSLEFCKIPDKKLQGPEDDDTPLQSKIQVYKVLADQSGNFATDDYQISSKKQEGKDCETKEPALYSSQIFLTSKSIFQVVLCRNNTDPVKTTLLPLGSACPAGTTAQAQAQANCNPTSLISH